MMKKEELTTVEEIHADFDAAYELLMEKLDIATSKEIKVPQEEQDRLDLAKELSQIGLSNAANVKTLTKKVGIIGESNKEVQANFDLKSEIKLLRLRIPNKMLSLAQLYFILDKYDLFIGKASRFIGTIPEKNSLDLLSFDKWRKESLCVNFQSNSLSKPLHEIEVQIGYLVVAPKSDFNLKKSTICVNQILDYTPKKLGDFIDEARKERIERNIKLRDPVILLPRLIKGTMFFFIVTKWGDEAELDEFQNPKDN